jgi:hypothetical protein
MGKKLQVFITHIEPEVALVLWQVRTDPETTLIRNDSRYVCDLCNKRLDWEPFPVIDLPTREELKDPEYVPVGGNAFCQSCARKFYHLTRKDVRRVERVWFCYDYVQQMTGASRT